MSAVPGRTSPPSAYARYAAARDASARARADAAQTPLQAVPTVRRRPLGRTPFAFLIGGLLVAGLVSLLMLNTALAQGAFIIDHLQTRSGQLTDQEQALDEQLAGEESPARLAARAAALGMVPGTNPAFIRVADGTILGVPAPGVKPTPQPGDTPVPGTAGTSGSRAKVSPTPAPGAPAAATSATAAGTTAKSTTGSGGN